MRHPAAVTMVACCFLLIVGGCKKDKNPTDTSFYGTITDAQTGQPVAGLSMELHFSSWGMGLLSNSGIKATDFTDQAGNYELRILAYEDNDQRDNYDVRSVSTGVYFDFSKTVSCPDADRRSTRIDVQIYRQLPITVRLRHSGPADNSLRAVCWVDMDTVDYSTTLETTAHQPVVEKPASVVAHVPVQFKTTTYHDNVLVSTQTLTRTFSQPGEVVVIDY